MIKNIMVFFVLLLNFLFAQKLEFSFSPSLETKTRKIISLNKNWTYEIDNEVRRVTVPFWIEDDRVILQNKIKLSEEKPSIYFLRFEGINGLEEVYFNDERIPFDPFEIDEYSFRIPTMLVRENGENSIKIVISRKLRIKEQNALAAKLELPDRKFGAYKDIYIELLPPIAISEVNLVSELDNNLLNGEVKFNYEVISYKNIRSDSSLNLSILIEVIDRKNQTVINSVSDKFSFQGNSITRSGSIVIKNPALWNLNNPSLYDVKFHLYLNENLIDQMVSQISFRRVYVKGSEIYLNNKPLTIRGVTYFESNGLNNSFFKLKDYERDINLIKELDINAIFVKNSFPSDELIYQCEKNGILVFLDLDSKVYPARSLNHLLMDKKRKLNFVVDKYSNFGCVAGLNLGSVGKQKSFDLFTSLKEKIRDSKFGILTFIESSELNNQNIQDFDFVAYNLLHKSVKEIEKFLSNLDENKFFLISSIGYNHGIDEEEGYSNPYSLQAQAKYFSDVLKILSEKNISFFVHTFSDYRLPYHSIIAGKIDNRLMKYGLVNEFRDKKKLSFQTYKSYLNESKLPIIMQGNYTENANVIFIVAGLLFLAMTIFIINSTHRFRENVSRAVLKTYNFFSDIRDGWFISSFHSVILAITIAFSTALTYSSILHYWKDKIEFEKFISIFNSSWLFEFTSYISWRPIQSIIYFTIILLAWTLILTILTKFFNFFVKNKIFINHAFLIIVWSGIPFLILIPLGMVAFKILSIEKYNNLIYFIVIFFHMWVITRALKGISIVFETKKFKVYAVSILFLIVVFASLILYLQINFSAIDYLMEYFV